MCEVPIVSQSSHSILSSAGSQRGGLPFMVLIERRAATLRQRLLTSLLMVVIVLTVLLGLSPAQAQTARSKVALDLQLVIASPITPKLNWAKDVNGMRMVKVLVVSNSTDPDLVALRADVLAKGGSVYLRFVSVSAISAMLPANQVAAIAARTDVQGISPDRLTARTASTLEYMTGALTANVRTYSSTNAYSGLDGTGVVIAVLD